MKNIDNTIKIPVLNVAGSENSTNQNLLVGTNHIRKSTLDMMFDSCHDYSSRVWNVVKADMQEAGEYNKTV